jgi:hypothetical protein
MEKLFFCQTGQLSYGKKLTKEELKSLTKRYGKMYKKLCKLRENLTNKEEIENYLSKLTKKVEKYQTPPFAGFSRQLSGRSSSGREYFSENIKYLRKLLLEGDVVEASAALRFLNRNGIEMGKLEEKLREEVTKVTKPSWSYKP